PTTTATRSNWGTLRPVTLDAAERSPTRATARLSHCGTRTLIHSLRRGTALKSHAGPQAVCLSASIGFPYLVPGHERQWCGVLLPFFVTAHQPAPPAAQTYT